MKTHPPSFRSCSQVTPCALPPLFTWGICILLAVLFSAGTAGAQSFIPVIDKVIAAEDNTTYFDHEGDTPAVLVIKNTGDAAGSVSNYSLTDTTTTPRKWVFPTVAGGALTIQAGQSLMVFASGKNRISATPLATNFILPCESTAYLYNSQSSLLSQKMVFSSDCPECLPLFNGNTLAAIMVPASAANPPSNWKDLNFNSSSWPRGQPCIGYDSDPLMQSMVLYSTFDAADVNTTLRTITDVTGPTLHTGTWPASAAAPHIGIPLTTLIRVIDNVGFTGPQNPNSYVSYADHDELDPGTGGYSWSIWVRPQNTDLNSSELILRKGMDSSTSNQGYTLTRAPNFSATFSLISGATTVSAVIPANSITRDVWHHISVVVQRGTVNTLTIFHNGIQRGQSVIPAGFSLNTTLPLYLARAIANGAIMYTGRMDDFATWNRTLTPAEITRIYEAGLAGKKIDDPSAPGSQAPIYTPCIETNVQTVMKGVNPSIYERIEFNVTNPAVISSVLLRMKYDDGFVAWINGVEVARRNAPASLAWNSAATIDRPDANALISEEIAVPQAAVNALVPGVNVLAIQGLNFTASDQRFLICPELCYDELTAEDCFVTTNGKSFWITFPGNAPEDATNPLSLSVCITGSAGTLGNVSIPGLVPAFSQNFVLPAGGKLEIALPKEASLEKSDLVERKGVRILASKNVAVYGKTRIDFSTDTFLAHPYRVLGSSYMVLGWGNSWTGYPELNGSQFGIVATADNTHVTVTPKVSTGSHPAGIAYAFILNEGETYMLRNTSDSPADLTGTTIVSDIPVAVFGGHRCANVTGSLFFCDTVLEQILPTAYWGLEYCTAPLATRTASELIRVVASENATSISINGVVQAGILNKGDKKDYFVAGGATFSSSKKFLAAHMSRSSDTDGVDFSDPFQLNAQPVSSWLSGYKFCTAPAAEFTGNYANVIARNAELAGVVFSPAIPPADMGPVIAIPGSPYSYRQMKLAAGTTYTTSGRTHGLEIYGWHEFDSYGHSGGMGFADTLPPSFTQCPPDITIYTANVPGAGQVATLPDLGAQFGVTDNCCPVQGITVTQTPPPGTLLQSGDYTVSITATDCVNNSVTCVVLVHVRTNPLQQAFPSQFGNPATEATIWGWTADPDGDQLTNEQEYMLGTSMTTPSDLGEAFSFQPGPGGNYDITIRIRTDDPSIDYSLEGSYDLSGWFGGLGHFTEISTVPDTLAGYSLITLRLAEVSGIDRLFVRLLLRRNSVP